MTAAVPSVPPAVARSTAAVGRGAPVAIHRLRGGTCKGVFRARWADGRTAIVYRWHPDEDQWGPAEGADQAGASGPAAFLEAHRLLTSIGVRVPAVLHGDPGDRGVDAIAVVEDVGDRRLEDVLVGSAGVRDRILVAFGAELRTLHSQQRDEHGPLRLGSGRIPPPPPFPDQILVRARRHLSEARSHPAIRPVGARLETMLHAAHRRVRPRAGATLVHGELGPDHVIVAADGRPCLIDIEGCSYADLEWEHAYLALRFGPHYAPLQPDHLDPTRLELYTLALHLSLVAGPNHLLTRIGPDPLMQSIVAHNAARLVELASAVN